MKHYLDEDEGSLNTDGKSMQILDTKALSQMRSASKKKVDLITKLENDLADMHTILSNYEGVYDFDSIDACDLENILKAGNNITITKLDDCTLEISSSGGVAFSSETNTSADLTNKADERLYEAKKSGRNRFKLIDSELVGD